MDSKDLQYAFSKMLQTDTIIRRKKRTQKNIKKDLFLSVIKKYDDKLVKSVMLQSQFNIDLSTYEEPFYSIIDDILLLSYGDDVYQLIAFYFYERIDIDSGEEKGIMQEDGSEIFIRTPEELYSLIQKLYPDFLD